MLVEGGYRKSTFGGTGMVERQLKQNSSSASAFPNYISGIHQSG